ncbi:hypothetical protein OAJ74_04020 [Alphaproteobacteria bacterium]|nr:hypothetical protein [Alphaproteobacteria bacterium]
MNIFGKDKSKMFFKSLITTLNNNYNDFNDGGFDNVDPNIVKYFRTEYGKDWKVALQHHLYKKSLKKTKKAA